MEHSLMICARCRTQLLSTRFIKQWTRHVTTQTTLHSQLPGFASQSLRVIRHVTSSSGARNLRKVEKELLEEDEGIARELDIPSRSPNEILIKSPSPVTPPTPSVTTPTLPVEEIAWTEQRVDWWKLPGVYLRLSKYRLSALVVLTALAGYTMAPAPLSVDSLMLGCIGTALCSASANTINQWMEVPFDSQMARTRNRVLVRNQISTLHAISFGALCGVSGSLILLLGVNSLTASLGLLNIVLYTCVYTPMKRISIVNTWAGSIVGAVPPLMGWAACTGTLGLDSLVLGGVLYAWQFPHFNALSWGLRGDYSRGGYRMMSVTDPDLCRRVALRYCIGLIPICTLAPVAGLTTWWFALDSLPLNLWFTYLGWRFYNESDFKSARKLFHFSLFHLPLVMILLILNKREWT